MLDPRISLDRTRDLIDNCLHSYFQSRLDVNRHPSFRGKPGKHATKPLPARSMFTSTKRNADDPVFAYDIPSPSRAPPAPPHLLPPSKIREDTTGDIHQYAQDPSRYMFRLLENYIISCFTSIECLNASFPVKPNSQLRRTLSENTALQSSSTSQPEDLVALESSFPELDAKTLLLGDFAENGIWWTGRGPFGRQQSQGNVTRALEGSLGGRVTIKTPRINWADVTEWYLLVASVGHSWKERLQEFISRTPPTGKSSTISDSLSTEVLDSIENDIAEASAHLQRTLLKASETLLRRPGRPLQRPEDCRSLLILLANPLLYDLRLTPLANPSTKSQDFASRPNSPATTSTHEAPVADQRSPSPRTSIVGRHSGIIKRALGLLANLPNECHCFLINWFSRLSEPHFRRLVDLVGSFVAYRLSRQHGRKHSDNYDIHGGLIPSISGPGAGTSAQLHAALGALETPKSPEKKKDSRGSYIEDWQIKAAAKVMSLLFSANIQTSPRLQNGNKASLSLGFAQTRSGSGSAPCDGVHPQSQLLPISAFYNTLIDHLDLVADFEAWESRRGKFSFCQYPMFLSIWAKIRIMEHDARRQMEIKAREAFFHSILNRKAVSQYLVLKVRRECLVEDSLRSVSEVVGTGQDDIKKGLRIDFIDEEGLDSGGLRKEWFLLLVRDVFDPEHGLFVYDEESQYCYFNPDSFETSDQFFLVGVVLGLAIYNSTILDIAFPPFAFRKLLASAPNYTGPTTSSIRSTHTHTLADLAEFRPALAHGLKQMLEFDGNVEETFCQDFVAVVERYGHISQVPLCVEGAKRPVTNDNRYEFVDLYVKYILDTSVARQYEPFKRGFFSVCEGNALTLFRPEEIELLIRGSDEPLDVATLRTVAIYDNWGKGLEPSDEPVITWFWDSFSKANSTNQRKLLSFITSSDRIPAMGAMCLTIKITCLGEDSDRFPIARTCFNMLGLYRYQTRETLEDRLWRAVNESEGFGMK